MAFPGDFFDLFHKKDRALRLRLAPTPSGFLHAGNGLNFIFTWLLARSHPNSRLVLRIDDLDRDRKRPEYVQDIFETLNWLGIDWDEGPVNPTDFEANWSQDARMESYTKALDILVEKDMVYACGLSRKDLQEQEPFLLQNLPLDAPDVNWRIHSDMYPNLEGLVVRKKDGRPSYHLACIVDEVNFSINAIIRGADLEESTKAQWELANALGWTSIFENISCIHHPLLLDEEGLKLSKSADSRALKSMREEGQGPEQIVSLAARWLGLSDKVSTSAELLDNCRVSNHLD
jgi:glutamyl-tRNA synthetase